MPIEMKDSGIEWIGKIPKEWQVIKNKHLLNNTYSGGTPTSSNPLFYSENGVPFVSISDMSSVEMINFTKKHLTEKGIKDKNLKILPKGTIIYSMYATVGEVAELNINSTISQAMLALNIKDSLVDKSFYKYNLKAMKDYVLREANGNTQFNLNAEKVTNFNFVVPPLSEQQAIANYLDEKTKEIDNAIEKTQKTIELYKEYKQSLITETVTKGLDPNAEMKDSGLPWVGKIPKKWKIGKLKRFLERNEPKNPGNKKVLSLYRDYGIVPKDSRDDNHNVTSLDTSKYKYVLPGDFVVNKMKAWQGSVAVSDYEGIVSPAYYVYKFKNNAFDKKYFHYLLRSSYKKEFRRLSAGIRIGQWDLPAEALNNVLLIIPNHNEQKEIVEYLDEHVAKIDQLIAEKQEIIEDLKTYKQSLIYEVVTGKKSVI